MEMNINIKGLLIDNNFKKVENICYEWLVERDYLYNKIIGWEKIWVYEKFNLNPNIKDIPMYLGDEEERQKIKYDEKDMFGKKTGNKIEQDRLVKTGKKTWKVCQNFLDYKKWKKEKDRVWIEKENNFQQL